MDQMQRFDVFAIAKEGLSTILSLVLRNLTVYDFNINSRDEEGNTLLHIVCKRGILNLIEMMVALGSDIDALNNNKDSPLHLVCSEGDIEIVKFLAEKSHTLHIYNKMNEIPIVKAFNNGHFDIVRYLLKFHEVLDGDYMYLLQAATETGNMEILDLCLKTFREIDVKNTEHLTLLQISLINGHTKIATYLIDKGANVNVIDQNARNLIHLAVLSRLNNAIIHSLLDKGVNINGQDKNGLTPLHYCVEMNSQQMFQLILKYHPNLNIQDVDGYTALHVVAARHKHINILTTLIKRRANPNLKTYNGDTALHLAASTGSLEAVKLLHSTAAVNNKLPNIYNQTAHHLAEINEHPDVVNFLVNSK